MSSRQNSAWLAGAGSVLAFLVFAVTPALAATLLPGESQWKDHPAVPENPDYITGLPAYFTAANLQAELVADHDPLPAPQLNGTTTSWVYRNPATDTYTFAYRTVAAVANTSRIIRATLGGDWVGVGITAAGADLSGNSGTGDTAPEWNTGDPALIYRNDEDGQATPAWQFRASFSGNQIGTVLGKGDQSAIVWFETDVWARLSNLETAKISFQDSGQIGQANVLVPVPDPATLGLLLVGTMVYLPRRRRA